MNILFELDKKIFLLIYGLQDFNLDYFLAWPTYLGTLSIGLPFLLMLMWLKERKQWIFKGLVLIVTILCTDFIVDFLKIAIARPRPFLLFEQQGMMIHVLFYLPKDFSFPSGHATLVFGAATILNFLYQHKLTWLYALAFLVAITRIYIGVHYPSDVLGGAFLGVVIAGIIYWATKRLFPDLFKSQ